jgi:hypothetical protein
MKPPTWMSLALAIGAALLALGVAVAFNNPTIDHTDDGTYQCFAPYDTILFGDRNDVGMHTDAQDIEARCYSADRDRFILASMSAGLGVVVAIAGAGSLIPHRRAS